MCRIVRPDSTKTPDWVRRQNICTEAVINKFDVQPVLLKCMSEWSDYAKLCVPFHRGDPLFVCKLDDCGAEASADAARKSSSLEDAGHGPQQQTLVEFVDSGGVDHWDLWNRRPAHPQHALPRALKRKAEPRTSYDRCSHSSIVGPPTDSNKRAQVGPATTAHLSPQDPPAVALKQEAGQPACPDQRPRPRCCGAGASADAFREYSSLEDAGHDPQQMQVEFMDSGGVDHWDLWKRRPHVPRALKRKAAEPSARCSHASVDSSKRTRVRDSALVALKRETGQPACDRNGAAGAWNGADGAFYDVTWPSYRGMPPTMFAEVQDADKWDKWTRGSINAAGHIAAPAESDADTQASVAKVVRQDALGLAQHLPVRASALVDSTSHSSMSTADDFASGASGAHMQPWWNLYQGHTVDPEHPPATTSTRGLAASISVLPICKVFSTGTDPRGYTPTVPLDPSVANVIRQDALGPAQRPRYYDDMDCWTRDKRRHFSHSDAGELTTSPHPTATDITAPAAAITPTSATVTASSACSSLASSGPASAHPDTSQDPTLASGVSQNSQLTDLSAGDSCEPMTPQACFPATVASSPQRVPTLGLPTTEAFSCAQEPGETRGEHH